MMGPRAALPGVILVTALSVACASGGVVRPEPFPRVTRDKAEGRALNHAAAVVDSALALQGRPYAPGGSGPDRFDCSGLVQFVFAQVDIALPRTVAQQFAVTMAVAPDEAAAGDLLFFRISGEKPSHVAIAIGDGRFVHAPNARGTVRVESLAAPYWQARFQGVRRIPVLLRTPRVSR
jgi:cell wall-associated NlpC family hydrolase